MRRFFLSPNIEVSDEVLLSEAESHHLTKVLRLPVGMPLQLFDGKGHIYDAEIMAMGKQVRLRILSSRYVEEDGSPLRICQGLLKGQKMEFLLQKCTELGVAEFIPFYSSRCQLKKTELRKVAEKDGRWQRIIDEACKQCNRPRPMQLGTAISLEDMVSQREEARQGILFWEEEKEVSLHTVSLSADSAGLQVVLGPEGGFSPEEAEYARKAGFQVLSLGPRILRAETATLAAVSIIQHLTGNM
ncbi:MAG: 16S rRNA (uracil(1498)-N(3))-methyltransferase [Proteobacteria bacterium]|nr:16S rRNA (uracil(1498)-N(3))-methyltransferase [Pseudomonadota bacterium]MBU1137825.1 16S rRNA (uracil(1498)-N(3))-methyltransferase [Pseudomonadota bacterium]MBU1233497.1 16S rRNA (uracil(1498)-N(3))-methyltransferase [Pseudomonadota bacterium]MBU1418768.1 16S rRNA (uracil(1498)-N(3))-methyltransferase [Pseudomonadota bacterium]MBU1455468.1 16S rRNA (uracil(1498)-N(3))-methyltransferase [Pseudomonadota bacterium]